MVRDVHTHFNRYFTCFLEDLNPCGFTPRCLFDSHYWNTKILSKDPFALLFGRNFHLIKPFVKTRLPFPS
jgi:hypothetical protein